MKYAVDPLNLLSPGSLVESSPICRTSTPPRPRDRAEAIVLADAFFVVSSLLPPRPLLGCPCPVSPCTEHPAPSENVSFYRSSRTAPVVAQGAVALCSKKARRRSWSLISSSSCSSSCSCSRSWSLISSSHQESVITDTPTLEAHHPAVTFFCWLRWKLLKLVFFWNDSFDSLQ